MVPLSVVTDHVVLIPTNVVVIRLVLINIIVALMHKKIVVLPIEVLTNVVHQRLCTSGKEEVYSFLFLVIIIYLFFLI